jgi:hypothetical protein
MSERHACTVLREPDSNQRAVLDQIARLSDRLVVMSERAVHLLRDVYDVPGEKIDLIRNVIRALQAIPVRHANLMYIFRGYPSTHQAAGR